VLSVTADLADVEALRPALEGAKALYLLVSGVGAHVDAPKLLAAARAAGVVRIVLQSSLAVATRPSAEAYAPLGAIEAALRDSGLDWTILRPGGFHTNTLAWAATIAAQRTAFTPFADVALPSVDPSDIAAVAALTLTDASHAGREYELTGPAALSPRQRVDVIARQLGETIALMEVSAEQAREEMLRMMPPLVVDATLEILGSPTERESQVSPTVEQLLGRPGRSYDEWVSRNIGAFA
jgi:uncharacterized protein YbjT (DUF2867 family)